MVQSTKTFAVLTTDTLRGLNGRGYQIKQTILALLLVSCLGCAFATGVLLHEYNEQSQAGLVLPQASKVAALLYAGLMSVITAMLLAKCMQRNENEAILSLVEEQHYLDALDAELLAKQQRMTWTREQLQNLSEPGYTKKLEPDDVVVGVVSQVREVGLLLNVGYKHNVFMPWQALGNGVFNVGDQLHVRALALYDYTEWGVMQVVTQPHPVGGYAPEDEEWFWGIEERIEAERMYELQLRVA